MQNFFLGLLRTLILLGLISVFPGCHKDNSLIKKEFYIFGTVIEVLIWHNNPKHVELALSTVEHSLNDMHWQWHAWKKGRLNEMNTALRKGNQFTITEEEKQFLEITQQLSKESLGYFNPAIGELINMWGFHTDVYPILEPPPSDKDIQDYLSHIPTMKDLKFYGNKIASLNDKIWLDLGGIAKGYAIDKAIGHLQDFGIKNAIVNAGGDLRSIGKKDAENWTIAIRKPNSQDIFATLLVDKDESVFTSGNYERYKEFDKKRYAHIIDPKTGYGIKHIISATVIAKNGIKADAAATALIVAGIQNWHNVMKSMDLDLVLLLDDKGQCYATSKLMKRLQNIQQECVISSI